MSLRYSVFKGPGNRLVAISRQPHKGSWLLKQGEQGKKLRSSTVPESKHANFASVQSDHVGSGYQLLFHGPIDAFGRSTDITSSLIFWEAKAIDVEHCRQLLRKYAAEMQDDGVQLEVVDDLSGTRVRILQTVFGVSRAPSPGCIDFDGNGGGSLSPVTSADLLCVVALLSTDVSISIADGQHKTLTRNQVIHTCIENVSEAMPLFLERYGIKSLVTALRNLNVNQVRF